MKELIKNLITRAAQNDFCWSLLERTLIRTANFAYWMRNLNNTEQRREIVRDGIRMVCPDLVIKNGPFKGILYPDITSIKSFAKVFGSYERELHTIIEEICQKRYTEIINIGCAEGYYAIGLAKRIPTAKVYAYDINQTAIQQCKEIASINNLDQRIITGSFCDTETLKKFSSSVMGLIISDCEGYEKELFTEEIAPLLSRFDMIIEIHDLVDITISSHIRQLFEKTHDLEIIQSIDDIQKAHTYRYKELENYDLMTRKILLAESRRSIMEWFYIKSRLK